MVRGAWRVEGGGLAPAPLAGAEPRFVTSRSGRGLVRAPAPLVGVGPGVRNQNEGAPLLFGRRTPGSTPTSGAGAQEVREAAALETNLRSTPTSGAGAEMKARGRFWR